LRCSYTKTGNFQITRTSKKVASRNGRAFLCLCDGHTSASCKDVTEVASFFCFKKDA